MNPLRAGSLRLARRALHPETRVPKRQSHGDDMPAEEAAKDIGTWKTWTYVGLGVLALFGAKIIFSGSHENPEKKAYSHLEIRRKPFPWGDGTLSMFTNLFGAPAHGHKDHH